MPTPVTRADSLLADLNGDLPPLAPGEIAATPAPSRDAELALASPAALRPGAAADAVHSVKAGGKGYRVTVEGEYLALAPGGTKGKVKKAYKVDFVLGKLDAALSIIKNKLLDPALKKKHSDWVATRTNKITDVAPLTHDTPPPTDLAYATRAQLEAHIRAVRAPIDAGAYPEIADLRDAVIDLAQNPKGFEEREAERQKDRLETAELRALNPGIEVGA